MTGGRIDLHIDHVGQVYRSRFRHDQCILIEDRWRLRYTITEPGPCGGSITSTREGTRAELAAFGTSLTEALEAVWATL